MEVSKELIKKPVLFVKGGPSPNPGGRPRGVSKKKLLLNSFLESVVNDNTGRFQKELKKLQGKAYVDAILTMMEYVRPKLARTEVTNPDGAQVQVKQVFVIGGKEIEL